MYIVHVPDMIMPLLVLSVYLVQSLIFLLASLFSFILHMDC